MMNPVKFSFLVYRARDFSRTLKFYKDDGTPMDFTGCSFVGGIARDFYDRNAPIPLTVTGNSQGELTLSLAPAITAQLGGTLYVYDVEMTDLLGKKVPVLFGSVLIRINVV